MAVMDEDGCVFLRETRNQAVEYNCEIQIGEMGNVRQNIPVALIMD